MSDDKTKVRALVRLWAAGALRMMANDEKLMTACFKKDIAEARAYLKEVICEGLETPS